ncbi:MAG: bifunctional metallophosphatase/5'-nucleotidase [Bacteroidales bacterium]|nr:bifunctional metallophosphatase/5'-nucleotidase [Bacteroidales bacterium]
MNKIICGLAAMIAAVSLSAQKRDAVIVATGNMHGNWFDSTFTSVKTRASLLQVSEAIKKIRKAEGDAPVFLVDIGGALEGHNAAFYYNKIAAGKAHLYPRMAAYMHYDAVMAGPDVSLGRNLIRLMQSLMRKAGVPYLHDGASCVIKKSGCRFGVMDGEDDAAAEAFFNRKKLDYVIYRQGSKAKVFDGTTVLTADAGKSGRYYAFFRPSMGEARKIYLSTAQRDADMWDAFKDDYYEVRAFIVAPIGELAVPLDVRKSFEGQSDYMNFYHSLALGEKGVDVSMSSPLALDGTLSAGPVSYGRIAELYPFDNRFVLLSLSGEEIKAFLEASYDAWLQGKTPANYESAGGICYTVDRSKSYGHRVNITSFTDGRPFKAGKRYNVSMTSYRASGAGGFLKAAGLADAESIKERMVTQGKTFREILYYYLLKHPVVDSGVISDPAVVGRWSFLP